MIRNSEETERANRFRAYVEGWRDGAAVRAMRREFDGHRLKCDYDDGYAAGTKARGEAFSAASAKYGHTQNILRLADVDSATRSDGGAK